MIVREPNSENCLDLILAAPPCDKVINVPDTNYITSATRKFMLDMPSPGNSQNILFLKPNYRTNIWAKGEGLKYLASDTDDPYTAFTPKVKLSYTAFTPKVKLS